MKFRKLPLILRLSGYMSLSLGLGKIYVFATLLIWRSENMNAVNFYYFRSFRSFGNFRQTVV